MSEPAVDIVTIFHNEVNRAQSLELLAGIEAHADKPFNFIAEDNTVVNRGFARACNEGAKLGTAPIIGFLNPDLKVKGPFIQAVEEALAYPDTVVTGHRFGKSDYEVRLWGCADWVCGAAFFVVREFWEQMDGFDERYVWSHEETDFIRRTQEKGKFVRSIPLPFDHASPDVDSPKDAAYKQWYFDQAARIFHETWKNR